MEKISIAAVKKVYTFDADQVQRGFYAYLRRLQADAKAAEADKVLEAAQKRSEEAAAAAKADPSEANKEAAKAAQKALKDAQKAIIDNRAAVAYDLRADSINALSEVMQRKGLKAEDFSKDFLLNWLPLRFNASQHICKVTLIPFEEEAKARKEFTPEALIERDDRLFFYKPIVLFTANSLLSEFMKAADARAKAKREEAKAAREAAEDPKKRAARIEAMRAKVAAYDAQQQQQQQQQTGSESTEEAK